ncbi:MAG TPA: hypothetical protein GXX36_06735 [Clostridiaceae bacterium]|nr:hypothetical protein [Clostridiaceae bacterium]
MTNGTVASISDANGGTMYYRYDGLNRLVEQWSPDDTSRYSYLQIIYDKAGNKLSEKTGKDKVGPFQVPAPDRYISVNYTYYPSGQIKTITDSAGRGKEYKYDRDGNLSVEKIYMSENTCNVTE